MQKNFKNTFGVSGNKHLIEAFRQEALTAGWKMHEGGSKIDKENLYFSSTGRYRLEKNHMWYAAGGKFKLPEQWDEAIACMKEEEAVDIPTNRMGRYKQAFCNSEYILSRFSMNDKWYAVLISLHDGNRFTEPTEIKQYPCGYSGYIMTDEEWKKVTAGQPEQFTKIK
jgi:hypothetical protein